MQLGGLLGRRAGWELVCNEELGWQETLRLIVFTLDAAVAASDPVRNPDRQLLVLFDLSGADCRKGRRQLVALVGAASQLKPARFWVMARCRVVVQDSRQQLGACGLQQSEALTQAGDESAVEVSGAA